MPVKSSFRNWKNGSGDKGLPEHCKLYRCGSKKQITKNAKRLSGFDKTESDSRLEKEPSGNLVSGENPVGGEEAQGSEIRVAEKSCFLGDAVLKYRLK